MAQDEAAKLKQMAANLKKMGPDVASLGDAFKGVAAGVQGAIHPVENLKKEISSVQGAVSGLMDSLTGAEWNLSLSSIMNHVNEMSRMTAGMNKATGAAGKLGPGLKAMREHADGLAVGYTELTQHMTAVYENMTAFGSLAPEIQGKFAGLASRLDKLGIGAAETAKNLDIMTKGLGMTADQAIKTQMDIAKTARSLGVAPKKMAADFAAAAPKLAAYGKAAFKEFRKLASQAAATGLEMNKLLGITEKFDTFEGAAEQTAQLNAVMGTQLNSIDLLMASEGDRIKMIKEGVDATGKSWDSMDRWEKKALAQAAGFDNVEEAGRLFGASMEDMADAEAAADPALTSQEELNAAMKKGVDRATAFQAMLEGIRSKLAKHLMPLVKKFLGWFKDTALPKLLESIQYFAGVVMPMFLAKWDEFYAKNGPFIDKWGGIILGVALALGPIIGILGGIISAVTVFTGVLSSSLIPILAIVGAIYLLWKNFESFRTVVIGVYEGAIKPFVSGFIDGFMLMWDQVSGVFVGIWEQFGYIWEDITSLFGDGTGDMAESFSNFGAMVGKVIGGIAEVVGHVANFMVRMWRKSFGMVIGLVKGILSLFRGDFSGALRSFIGVLIDALLFPIERVIAGVIAVLDIFGLFTSTTAKFKNARGDVDISGWIKSSIPWHLMGLEAARTGATAAARREDVQAASRRAVAAGETAPGTELAQLKKAGAPKVRAKPKARTAAEASAMASATTSDRAAEKKAGPTTIIVEVDSRVLFETTVKPYLNSRVKIV